MPYTRFVRTKKGISVYKRQGGREVKAFTAHTQSMAKARQTARRREGHRKR
jgi:hypothetical protein